MNAGLERQAEADAINEQSAATLVENDLANKKAEEVANSENRQSTRELMIKDLELRLETLRQQAPEADVRIGALENQIEALKKNNS